MSGLMGRLAVPRLGQRMSILPSIRYADPPQSGILEPGQYRLQPERPNFQFVPEFWDWAARSPALSPRTDRRRHRMPGTKAPRRLVPFSFRLGADSAKTYDLDRLIASAAVEAASGLEPTSEQSYSWALKACWRHLKTEVWSEVAALRSKLEGFLSSGGTSIPLTEREWKLMNELLDCADELLSEDIAQTGGALERVAAAVGIAGGLVMLASAL